ncbi:hypothetical protein TWF694_004420 [Orbilia ellipsospora]|uniref:Capsule polysaccharide biosynthesis protein n=1 Tax=Orbilia ellipsospora TaxID=2528407 RepID=A0AAV9WV27_9PEZI
MVQKFEIPEEFRSELRYVQPHDNRTDAEIIQVLTSPKPITSERNLWGFWHSGVESMPGWCQRNVASWVRLCGPTWNIRILDMVEGSANNALKWVDPSLLPEAFVNKTMDGPWVGPHSADMLRGAVLYTYGGAWMDVGCVMIRPLHRIFWQQLEDPSLPYEICVPWLFDSMMANHFVAARKGNKFIKAWHDLFLHFWKGRRNIEGIGHEPLIKFCETMGMGGYAKAGFIWDMKVDGFTLNQYASQVLAWWRLCIIDGGDHEGEFDYADYAETHIFWIRGFKEMYGAQVVVGFEGQDLFDAFSTRLDADPESEEYQKAYKVVWGLLTKCCWQKVSHAKELTTRPDLGLLWSMNDKTDAAPGTFAELLRYGAENFQQVREEVLTKDWKKSDFVMHKGLYEV